MSKKLDSAEESILIAATTVEDTLTQVEEVEDRVTSKLGDLEFIGEKIMNKLSE